MAKAGAARAPEPGKTRKQPRRAERLGFRLDDVTKAVIERAAALERCKVTEFCVAALLDSARRTIQRHETLVLSDRDRRVFFETLINPPKPNARLKRAFAGAGRRISR